MDNQEVKITHEEYYLALNTCRKYKEQISKDLIHLEKDADVFVQKVDNKERFKDVTPDALLYDCHCSVRLFNSIRMILHFNNIPEVHECRIKRLSEISLLNFARQHNVGKKTIQELKDLCECAKINLLP